MPYTTTTLCPTDHCNQTRSFPADARDILAILDEAFPPLGERRDARRQRLRIAAQIHLPHERLGTVVEPVYTRDADAWNLGLICQTRLPVGTRLTLEIPGAGGALEVQCEVRRCRECTPGWFEACVHLMDGA